MENILNEVNTFAESLIEIARTYVREMLSDKDIENRFGNTLNEIEKKYGKFSVIENLFFDLMNEDCNNFSNEDKLLKEWGYKAEQCIIQDRNFVLEKEYHYQSKLIPLKISFNSGIEISSEKFVNIFHYIDNNKDKMDISTVTFNAFKQEGLENVTYENMMEVFEVYNNCYI